MQTSSTTASSIAQQSLIEQVQWQQQAQNGTAYDSISNTTRKALVKLVTEQNLSVRKASKILKIKYTTAKALVQKYRLSGNIDRQRARRMTFEDDQRERFRKDLIKKLPIEVEEESDDEIKWGSAAQSLQNSSVLNGGMVTNGTTSAPSMTQMAQYQQQVQQRFAYQQPYTQTVPLNNSIYTWSTNYIAYRPQQPVLYTLYPQSLAQDQKEKATQPQEQISFDFGFYTQQIATTYEKKSGKDDLQIQDNKSESIQLTD